MMDNLSQEKLKELESKCIQEEEPWCTAMCPIHIDARQLCKLVLNVIKEYENEIKRLKSKIKETK